MTKNWEALKLLKPGTLLYHEWIQENLRFMVVRGPGAVCAYIGIPVDHPTAGKDYDSLPHEIDVHGGFTFSNEGDGAPFEEGWWWYGWDYAHAGDYCFYLDSLPKELRISRNYPTQERKWTAYDVIKDSRSALTQFKNWMEWIEIPEEDRDHAKYRYSNSD